MQPSFPPLLSGLAVEGQTDPFVRAREMAEQGCDAGLIVHNVSVNELRAAIVFAPEVPLVDAMAMLPACGIGFQNALGALGPPEVAVHLEWDGGIRVNGARCGRLRAAASDSDPDFAPDWLVIGLQVPIWETSESPGETPDQTSLYSEGCAEVEPTGLLESWARHTLVWINRWTDDGVAPLHGEWRGLAVGIGDEVSFGGTNGTFIGVDERFGMLLRTGSETQLIPLTEILGAD